MRIDVANTVNNSTVRVFVETRHDQMTDALSALDAARDEIAARMGESS